MSRLVTTARLVVVTLTALAVSAPAAQAQPHPAETWRPPFPPPAPIPADAWFVDTQATQGPADPGFWEPGPTAMRVVSPTPADSPTWCESYWNAPGVRCWQVSGPDRAVVELRRIPLLSDLWAGSSAPWGQAAYQAGYRIAREQGWDYDSGGIHVPTGSGTTYSTMMPFGGDSPSLDVWVHPGFAPGS